MRASHDLRADLTLLTANKMSGSQQLFGSNNLVVAGSEQEKMPSMRLREFSADGDDIATLVCAPLALHDATLTDFAPDHSLVAALQMAGLRNVFVTDWRSASPEMRFFSIDSYLADLNVVVDELGGLRVALQQWLLESRATETLRC